MHVFQSSTYVSGIVVYPAQYAVDGDITTFAHTERSPPLMTWGADFRGMLLAQGYSVVYSFLSRI